MSTTTEEPAYDDTPSKALAVPEPSTALARRVDDTLDRNVVGPAINLAKYIADTEMVPKDIRGSAPKVTAVILAGRELGLPPVASLAKVHIIEGRAALSAEAMRALIFAHGHEVWFEDESATRVIIAGRRRDWPEGRVSRVEWTADMTKKAGIGGKAVHQRYPRQMLKARCTGELCRDIFPDVLAGISYTQEELHGGWVNVETDESGDGLFAEEVVEEEPEAAAAPTASELKPRSKRQPAPEPEEVEVEDAELVEDAPEHEEPPAEPGMPDGQYRAMRLAQIGIRTDADRHAVNLLASWGRATSSGELNEEEFTAALNIAEGLDEDRWVLVVNGDHVGLRDPDGLPLRRVAWPEGYVEADPVDHEWALVVEVVEEPPEGGGAVYETSAEVEEEEAPPADADAWRALVKSKGIKLPELLRQATELADGDPPTSIPTIVGHPVAAALAAWVRSR